MTCKACEQRVGKALRRIPGVQGAQVSAAKGRAVISSKDPIPSAEISAAVKKAGYRIGREKREWITTDWRVWADVAAAAAIVLVVVLLATRFGWLEAADSISQAASTGSLIFVALLGVAASLSTCMALVGGVVISLSASFAASHPQATTAQRILPQVAFNVGRIVGFGLLGALLGLVGSAFTVSGWVLGALMLAVVVVMGLLGIRLTGVSPRLAGSGFALPAKLTDWMFTDNSYRAWTGLALGAASFFLPCGFTQAVQVYALSTGNPLTAGLTMAVFALGTTPGLLGVGSLATLIKTDRVFRYVGVLVLAFAVFVAISTFGSTVAQSTPSPVPTAAERTSNVTDVDGFQVATLTVASGYSPKDTVVYAGEPVRWTFDVQGFGCASALNASKLGIEEYIYLDPGESSVDFTLPEPGVYPFSCAMGMYTGTITAIAK
jgi:sulfite exporter TauE/SafE/copper chaperone CopZ